MANTNGLLEKVYKVISDIFTTSVEVETEPPKFNSYPFRQAWKGHNDAISYILNNRSSVLDYPTGTGKTIIYLTAAVESRLKTMIIVPRNALQEQVASYESRIGVPILYLFDRSKHCNKKKQNNKVPCFSKFIKNNGWYFKLNDKIVEFPCKDCPYEIRKAVIKDMFNTSDCLVVLNQGNFWMLRRYAKFVVIDEADETLKCIVSAVSYPKPYDSSDPVEVLEWMRTNVVADMERILKALETVRDKDELERLNRAFQRLERKLRKIEFFLSYPTDKLITYVKKDTTYVEVFDTQSNIVRKLFPNAKVCLVTATPPSDIATPNLKFDLKFRSKVIYSPIGNMSVRNVVYGKNEHLFDVAADFIIKSYDYIVNLTGMRKAPIHCGNLGKYGVKIYEILKANGRNVVLMEEGNQVQSVREFLESGADFFCAVSIEYGFDWGFSPIQYVLKVPYADLGDPRLKAIRKLLGKEKFDEWYSWDAMSRLIQACGRNTRRPDDFGVTIILDSCFERLYKRFEDRIPQWFKDRLIWLNGVVDDGE